MLCASQNGGWFLKRFSLKAPDRGRAEQFHEFGRFAEALVCAAPTRIASYGDTRGKGPTDAGCGHFLGGDAGSLFDQRRVSGSAHADVVGKNDCPIDVVMAVDGVDAI